MFLFQLPDISGRRRFVKLLTITLCAVLAPTVQAQDDLRPNILVIIGDDMGIETLGSFGVGSDTPTTATLDALAARGLSFNNMWAQPVCSPTRATILTGRYGFRTGVGGPTGDSIARGFIPEPPPVPAGVVEVSGMGGGMGMGMGAPTDEDPPGRWGITLDEFTLTQAFNTASRLPLRQGRYRKMASGRRA